MRSVPKIQKTSVADVADYTAEILSALKTMAEKHGMTLLANLLEFARMEAARNCKLQDMRDTEQKARKTAA
jgi:hypothetical protein